MSMLIGIDVGPARGARTGVGQYCYYLVKHLLQLQDTCGLKAFSTGLHRMDASLFGSGLFQRHIPVPTRVAYTMWETFRWPPVDTLLNGVDVYHATNYFLPPTKTAKRVLTIHDLSFLAVPQLSSPKIIAPFSRNIGRFAHDADAILTYSDSTTRDIVTHLGITPDKITVAPLAVDDGFRALPRAAAAAYLADRYGVTQPYILFVGMIEPRKNLPTLLSAFSMIRDEVPHRLVLAGATGWAPEAFHRALDVANLGDRVLQTGYIPNHSELAAFYSAADLFVFPTFYEGFGLPVLEAMTCGCPVAAANNSSLPEVAGDAAMLLPAGDVDKWAEAIRTLLRDADRREALAAAGSRQAARFSWHDCAVRTADVYRSLV